MVEREQLQQSVQKIVPTATNFARDALGTKDPDAYYRQVLGAALLALQADADALYYIAYLATRRLALDATQVLAVLDQLLSPEGILALANEEHARVTSVQDLTAARSALVRMDAAVAGGTFGALHLQKFKDQVTSFVQNQVAPNVRNGGSRTAARAGIRSAVSSLGPAWEALRARQVEVSGVVEANDAGDFRVVLAATISAALTDLVRGIETTLPKLADEVQAAAMRQTLSDLAAALATAALIQTTPTTAGEVVAGPRADGFTESTFRTTTGRAQVAPPQVVFAGSHGRVDAAAALVGVAGAAQDDADADPLTPFLVDAGVPDFTVSVEVGHYLTFASSGNVHQVVGVEAARLRLLPEIRVSLTGARWFTSPSAPGTFFYDTEKDFWVTYEGGVTGSTVLGQGTRGYFPRRVRVSGTGLTERLYQSSTGEAFPYERSGVGGLIGFAPTDAYLAGALLQTWGIPPGWYLRIFGPTIDPAEVREITLVVPGFEDEARVSPGYSDTGTVGTWDIQKVGDVSDRLRDTAADFLSMGLLPGYDVVVTAPPSIAGAFVLDDVLEDNLLVLTSSMAQHETGVSWYIQLPANEVCDPTAAFLSSGLTTGTFVDVEGTVYEVASASQERLVFTTPYTPPVPGSPATWRVFQSLTGSDVFAQDDGVDFTLVTPVTDGAPTILEVDGVVRAWTRPDPSNPTDSLDLRVGVPYDDAPVHVWSLRAGDTTRRFVDLTNAPFGDVAPGTVLVLYPGTEDAITVQVESVVSASEVILAGSVPQGRVNVPYAIYQAIRPGYELVVNRLRYPIAEIVDGSLRLARPLPSDVGVDLTYFIIEPGRYGLSNLLTDPVGAETYNPGDGFGPELVGQVARLNYIIPRTTRVLGILDTDGDGLVETLQVEDAFEFGGPDVPYQVWGTVEGTTLFVKVPSNLALLEGDLLTVWSEPSVFSLVDADSDGGVTALELASYLPGGQEGLRLAVTRGLPRSAGRWSIFQDLLDSVVLQDGAPFGLSTNLAQAMVDGGAVGTPVGSGSAVAVVDDGDGDSTTPWVDLTPAPTGLRYGDKLVLQKVGGGTLVVHVLSVSGARVQVTREVPVSSSLAAWTATRTAVSQSLYETKVMHDAVQGILDACAGFEVVPSDAVRAALRLLVDNGLDRSVDALRLGKLAGVAAATRMASSYAGAAAAALRGAGTSFAETDASGQDAAYGNTALGDGFSRLDAPTTVQAALGEGSEALAADEAESTTAAASVDDARNRAIYALTGEVTETQVSSQDPTLPWLQQTGSKVDQVNRLAERVKRSLQYVLDHADEFEEPS